MTSARYERTLLDQLARGHLDERLRQQHRGGRVAGRDEAVRTGYPGDMARESRVGERGDHSFGYAAGVPGLVGDKHPPGGRCLAEHVCHR